MFPPLEPGPLQLIDIDAHIPPRGGPVFASMAAELFGRLDGADAAAALEQADVGQANADDLADEWATSGATLQRTVADENAAPLPGVADEQRRTDGQVAGVGGVRDELPGKDDAEPEITIVTTRGQQFVIPAGEKAMPRSVWTSPIVVGDDEPLDDKLDRMQRTAETEPPQ